MPAQADATLRDEQGRSVLRFERTFRHPPERVWRALIEESQQRSWHPTPFELEPRVGGTVTYLPGEDSPEMPPGEVLEYDPPRLLAHSWDEDLLRWELSEHDGGCRLVLTHTFDDRFKAARDAAGWHVCLEGLDRTLEGERPPHGENGERLPSQWRELNGDYQRRFGIAPEQATPPPQL